MELAITSTSPSDPPRVYQKWQEHQRRFADSETRLAYRAFRQSRYRAARRGIPFPMTFDQWRRIWQKSGHWHERGTGRGKYQMARIGDRGPYAVGNVKIITHEHQQVSSC